MGKSAWITLFVAATAFGASAAATAATMATCDPQALRQIPARPPSAATASQFVRTIAVADDDARESAIRAELLEGNVPQFLRRLVPVDMPANGPNGEDVVVCAMPDYLAVGSDPDFLRLPMRLATALSVATQFGFVLPTRKIVDAIAAQAPAHLAPQPLPAGPAMRSTDYYRTHNDLIEAQRHTLGVELGELVDGDKKDLVITNRLWAKLENVAIYGWHRLDGTPIQPLSTLHGERYADYSHGVRLVGAMAYVDGRPRAIVDLLEDPAWAATLSDEGPMPRIGELMDVLRAK